MPEEYLVRHCSPTLAGMKTGSLFVCPYDSKETLREEIRQLNRRLGPKGLRILPLRFSEKRVTIYVYRPAGLTRDLSEAAAAAILQQQGYTLGNCCEHCIAQLVRRLREQSSFPHEIGLFLGYPPEDVLGFIENKAQGCKCVGCWKVYGDEETAKNCFAKYEKCTRVYCDKWAQGRTIERLTVSCIKRQNSIPSSPQSH